MEMEFHRIECLLACLANTASRALRLLDDLSEEINEVHQDENEQFHLLAFLFSVDDLVTEICRAWQ